MIFLSTLRSRFFFNLFKTMVLIEHYKKFRYVLTFYPVLLLVVFTFLLSEPISFNNLTQRVPPLYIFYLSSTIALYIFLYRERKDVSKNYSNDSFQHHIFITTLTVIFASLFLSYILSAKMFLIIVSTFIYFINLIVTVVYSDIYRITSIRLRYLVKFMEHYINFVIENDSIDTSGKRLRTGLTIFIFFTSSVLFLIISSFNIVILAVISILSILILPGFFDIRSHTTNITSSLKYLNSKSFSTQSGIAYVNGNIEKTLESYLKSLVISYNELVRQILLGDNKKFHKLVSYQAKHKGMDKVMVAFYDNTLTTYKEIILSQNIDQDVNETFSRFLYEMSPVVNYNNISGEGIPDKINKLNYGYSIVNTKIMIDLLTKFFLDIRGNKADFFRGYFEQTLTDIRESKTINNEKKFIENAITIECTVLSNLILKNNLHGVIAIMPAIIEKRNLKIKDLDREYLDHLIMLLIKSVEIEQLSISGYLVKIICSNYPPALINEIFEDIQRKNFKIENETREENWVLKFHTIGNEDIFIINGPSLKYCFFKAYLILKIYNFKKEEFNLNINADLNEQLHNKIKEDLNELDIDEKVFEKYEKIVLLKNSIISNA